MGALGGKPSLQAPEALSGGSMTLADSVKWMPSFIIFDAGDSRLKTH
ncbi:MAG: hypothetical protein LBU32_01530 [Clostridiales bacterium]|nr:hypothetical protein [Clostridiales bacterium]